MMENGPNIITFKIIKKKKKFNKIFKKKNFRKSKPDPDQSKGEKII